MTLEELSYTLAERNGDTDQWMAPYHPFRYYLPNIFVGLVVIAFKLGLLALAVWLVVKILCAMGVLA